MHAACKYQWELVFFALNVFDTKQFFFFFREYTHYFEYPIPLASSWNNVYTNDNINQFEHCHLIHHSLDCM